MKEVLQVAYLRHLQDFYLFESVKDGIIGFLACNIEVFRKKDKIFMPLSALCSVV